MNKLPDNGGYKVHPYEEWEFLATRMIESEMEKRGIRYKQLSRMLEEKGIFESPGQINRKVNRQRFSAAFLLACLSAMGVETLPLKLPTHEQG